MQIHIDLSPEQSLSSLCVLRGCAILGLLATVFGGHYGLKLSLPVVPMLILAAALAGWTLLTLWRLSRRWVVTPAEIFVHLAVDSLALTLLFQMSGGPGNPFISFYLVPIAIGAVMLSRPWAWAVTLMGMLLYSWLMASDMPHRQHHAGGDSFQLHVLGMWLNFLLSAVLVTTFVTLVAEAARRRDRSLALAREEALRNEQILAVGTLAAGAAHELSTPLSTMAITIGELRDQHQHNTELVSDLQLLQGQIDVCRQQLDLLLTAAGQRRAADASSQLSASAFLHEVMDRFRLMRPEATLQATIDATLSTLLIRNERTLAQAILAALNNAAEASSAAGARDIRLQARLDAGHLLLEIHDQGKGLGPEHRALAGRGIFSTKPQGYGLGLVLSHATLERLDGEMQLEPATGGGTLTRIRVPLKPLQYSDIAKT